MNAEEQYALPGKYQLGAGAWTDRFGQDVAQYVDQMRPSARAFYRDGSVWVTVDRTIGLDASDFAFTGPWQSVEQIPSQGAPGAILAACGALFLLLASGKR